MTPEEFQYIKRAVEALEGDLSDMSRTKVLRTISQICIASADNIQNNLVDKVNNRLYNSNTQTERV